MTKVNVKISGAGQADRIYTLDLSQPDEMPAELRLEREAVDGRITYKITDAGGLVVSAFEIVLAFMETNLAIKYVDQHFLEKFGYEVLGDKLVRVRYEDCSACVADLNVSILPKGFSVKNNEPGYLDLETPAAYGKYSLELAIKRSASATAITMAKISITLKASQTAQSELCNVAQSTSGKPIYQSVAGAQSFKAIEEKVAHVRLSVAALNGTPEGPLHVEIRSSDLREVYYVGNIFPENLHKPFSNQFVSFTYTTWNRLVVGREYTLVFMATSSSNENPWLVNQTSSDVCAGTSSLSQASEDFHFEVMFTGRTAVGAISGDWAWPSITGTNPAPAIGETTILNWGMIPAAMWN